MLPKAGAAAAAKGKRKAPAGDAAGTRKKPATAAKTVCVMWPLPLLLLQAGSADIRALAVGARRCFVESSAYLIMQCTYSR